MLLSDVFETHSELIDTGVFITDIGRSHGLPAKMLESVEQFNIV